MQVTIFFALNVLYVIYAAFAKIKAKKYEDIACCETWLFRQ